MTSSLCSFKLGSLSSVKWTEKLLERLRFLIFFDTDRTIRPGSSGVEQLHGKE